MHQVDILNKIGSYLDIISQFKTDIQEINVRNSIEKFYGRRYCRVYIEIKPKEGSEKSHEINDAKWRKFIYDERRDYFSFYLGEDHILYKELGNSFNEEERIHYDYIYYILTWLLDQLTIKIPVTQAYFVSESAVRHKEKQREEEWDKLLKKIEEATAQISPEVGQIIGFVEYLSHPIRFGLVEKITLPVKRTSFSMDLAILKKDLSKGKLTKNFWSKRDIYAIIDPGELKPGTQLSEIKEFVESGISFEGLIWRRPKELWDEEKTFFSNRNSE